MQPLLVLFGLISLYVGHAVACEVRHSVISIVRHTRVVCDHDYDGATFMGFLTGLFAAVSLFNGFYIAYSVI